MKTKGIVGAAVMSDFSSVHLELDIESGPPISLDLSYATLDDTITKLSEMLRHMQQNRDNNGDHAVVVAAHVVDAAATAQVGGGRVVLMLRTENGLVQNFGLPPQVSARLRGELEGAEESVQREGRQTRQ